MQIGDPRYAGFWRRFGAGAVDALLFIPITVTFALLETQSQPAAFLVAILNNTFFYLYVLPMTARYGATVGKLVTGIRVVPADGSPLRWRHVWLRSSVDILMSTLMLATTLVGLSRVAFEEYQAAPWDQRGKLLTETTPWYEGMVWLYLVWIASEFVVIFLNPRRRAIHDFIAGTVVIVKNADRSAPVEGKLS